MRRARRHVRAIGTAAIVDSKDGKDAEQHNEEQSNEEVEENDGESPHEEWRAEYETRSEASIEEWERNDRVERKKRRR